MTTRLPADQQITAWLNANAARQAPLGLLQQSLDRAAKLGQERYLTQRIFGDRLGRSRELRLVILAALLTLGVVGAIAVVGALLLAPPKPQATPSGWIAFTRREGTEPASPETVLLVREGEPAQRIVGAEGDGFDYSCPAFSPDGLRLAYGEAPASENLSAQAAIVVAAVDTAGHLSAAKRVDLAIEGAAVRIAACLRWSPDGEELAYISTSGELRILDGASSAPTVLPIGPGLPAPVAFDWSPDGSEIAVTTQRAILIVPVDGTAPRTLVTSRTSPDTGTEEYDSLSWSPDGASLAVWGENNYSVGGSFIRVFAVATAEPVDIPTEGPVYGPMWSDDGEHLAFVQGRADIVVATRDGLEVRLLTRLDPEADGNVAGVGSFVVWSRDGQQLLYSVWRGDGSRDPANDLWALASISLDNGTVPVLITPFDSHHVNPSSWQEDDR